LFPITASFVILIFCQSLCKNLLEPIIKTYINSIT